MKRLSLLFIFLFVIVLKASSVQTSKVWICTSSGAYAYHNNRACSGLNNCKATIIQVTEKEAIEKWGRKKCKRCYHLNKVLIYSDFLYSEDAHIKASYYI